MVMRILCCLCIAALTGCLREPKATTCAEFPVGTDPESCGEPCQIYCEALIEACPDSIERGDTEADKLMNCLGDCLELDASGTFNDISGNTLQCRITAAVAAKSDPAMCAAASDGGGGVCSDARCDEYCQVMDANCNTAFNNREGCLATCAVFPTGGNEVSGNSLECRAAAARRAANEPDECESAAPAGSGSVCGSACEAYCDQVLTNCPDLYVGADSVKKREACLDACSYMDEEASFDDFQVDGDSVQCRTYHASAPAAISPGTHCPHAGLYNDDHCGTTCETYCDICDDDFASERECTAACDAIRGTDEPLYPDPGAGFICEQGEDD